MVDLSILALQKIYNDTRKDAGDNLHVSCARWPHWVVALVCYSREALIFGDVQKYRIFIFEIQPQTSLAGICLRNYPEYSGSLTTTQSSAVENCPSLVYSLLIEVCFDIIVCYCRNSDCSTRQIIIKFMEKDVW